MPPCLTQHCRVWIKGKVEQFRERVVPSPTPRCSSYWKGSLLVTLIDNSCDSRMHIGIRVFGHVTNTIVLLSGKFLSTPNACHYCFISSFKSKMWLVAFVFSTYQPLLGYFTLNPAQQLQLILMGCQGLFYTWKLGNHIHSPFILAFFL